jgi:hypothetical protein
MTLLCHRLLPSPRLPLILTCVRRRSAEADEHPDRYSLLNIQRPFVVPGGRFREFYYWYYAAVLQNL